MASTTLLLFDCAVAFFVIFAGHARSFVPARRAGPAITCINVVGLTGVFVMQTGTGALINLIVRPGGALETGYPLVFFGMIAILLVAGAMYNRQPEAAEGPLGRTADRPVLTWARIYRTRAQGAAYLKG